MSATDRSETRRLDDVAGTLVLVGAGKMGAALLEGWLALGLDPAKLVVIEPQPSREFLARAATGVRLNPQSRDLHATAVVVAVKPQIAAEVMPRLATLIDPRTVVVSIMAGRTLAFLEAALPGQAAIVRAMPNLPAAVGQGITAAIANGRTTPQQRDLAHQLLGATGAVE